MVATNTAMPTGADLVARIPANTASDDPGSSVADVNADRNKVTRISKLNHCAG